MHINSIVVLYMNNDRNNYITKHETLFHYTPSLSGMTDLANSEIFNKTHEMTKS